MRRRQRTGFLLIELLVVLILLAAFWLVFEQLFITIDRAQTSAVKQDALIHRADAALALLRRDVWGASDVRVTGDALEILVGSGPRIVWTGKTDGQWTRNEAGAAPRTWRDMPAVRFEVAGGAGGAGAGALVTVIVGPAVVERGGESGAAEERAVLCSQRLLAGQLEGGAR